MRCAKYIHIFNKIQSQPFQIAIIFIRIPNVVVAFDDVEMIYSRVGWPLLFKTTECKSIVRTNSTLNFNCILLLLFVVIIFSNEHLFSNQMYQNQKWKGDFFRILERVEKREKEYIV